MNPIKLSTLFLTSAVLVACGGGGSPSGDDTTDTNGTTNGTGTTGGGTSGGTDGTDGSGSAVINVGLGAGVGAEFRPGELEIDQAYALAGSNLAVTATVVNIDSANELLQQPFDFIFTSTCAAADPATATFSLSSIGSTNGTATSLYRTTPSCTGNDTITVTLRDSAGENVTTAESTIGTAVPQLGSGTGANFFNGVISGNKVLTEESSTLLSAQVVDPENLNSPFESDEYEVRWTSTCTDATFSISSQSQIGTSELLTRYDANSCTGTDTVTLSLYSRADISSPLIQTTTAIEIGTGVTEVISPVLGVGSGSNFIPGKVAAESSYVLAGSSLELTVNPVDANKQNELLTETYQYQFVSTQCPAGTTSFGSSIINSNSSQVKNTYYNRTCGVADSVEVRMFAANADVTTDSPLSTAVIAIEGGVPRIGSGTGANFIDGQFDGDMVLVEDASTLLRASVVDPLDVNTQIESTEYRVEWSSSCAASGFSIEKQNLSSSVETRYDANTCTPSDTVTLTLYNQFDDVIASASSTITIGADVNEAIAPALGTGSGSNFVQGAIEVASSYVLAGSSVQLNFNVVDLNKQNALLAGNYKYQFVSSLCPAGTTTFGSNVLTTNATEVTNTYYNRTCSIADSVQVRMFDSNADILSATPLATATVIVDSDVPRIGSGDGAEFIEGVFAGNTILIDEASTFLTASIVDPLNVNTLIESDDYRVEWSSSCSASGFSIEKQDLSSAVSTRYDANTCTGSDTITLTLFNQFDDLIASESSSITISDSVAPAVPDIGRGVDAGFVAGEIDIALANLSASGNTQISVNIVDESDNSLISGKDYAVEFTSRCSQDTPPLAEINSQQVVTNDGEAISFYKANGCAGEDRIVANLYAVNNSVVDKTQILATASGTVNIELPEVNSIEFTSMTSDKIAIKGIGFSALPETTEVNFTVKDEFNKPITGKEVTFSLSNQSSGATLAGAATTVTNQDGIATAFVNSGTTHGNVTVIANTQNNDNTATISTQSFPIAITTGVPDQNSFSLSVDKFNPRGWDLYGEEVNLTVRVNDHFQNPVPDGTQVNFIAESGSIESTCQTAGGSCSVIWRSANPRPGFDLSQDQRSNDADYGIIANDIASHPTLASDNTWLGGRSGVATIIAYTEGEAGFADANGNGLFDINPDINNDGIADMAEESFNQLSEAFLDANENGVYDVPNANNPFEQLIEYTANGVQDPNGSKYRGASCTAAAKADGHCASLIHIRESVSLIVADGTTPTVELQGIRGINNGGGTTDLTAETCINVAKQGQVEFTYRVYDVNGNIPPQGTNVAFNADGFEIAGTAPRPVANSGTAAPIQYVTTIAADTTPDDGTALFEVFPQNDGAAGFARSPTLTDDPSTNVITDSRVVDVSAGSQTIELTFVDACGNSPEDTMEFELTLANGEFTTGASDFRIGDGADLDANGRITFTIQGDGVSNTNDAGLSVVVYDLVGNSYISRIFLYKVID